MARLNPFKAKERHDDEEDQGQEIDGTTIAGGGHHAFPADQWRVSHALQDFLAHEGVVSEGNVEALGALLAMPVVSPPAHLLDRSHPLPEYFISSSHNTYLMAHQLYGTSSAGAYDTTLKAGARCIEIDAW
jgi:phosphatidylinositol phospholipase C delta